MISSLVKKQILHWPRPSLGGPFGSWRWDSLFARPYIFNPLISGEYRILTPPPDGWAGEQHAYISRPRRPLGYGSIVDQGCMGYSGAHTAMGMFRGETFWGLMGQDALHTLIVLVYFIQALSFDDVYKLSIGQGCVFPGDDGVDGVVPSATFYAHQGCVWR